MKKTLLTLTKSLLIHCVILTGLQAQNCTFTDLRLTNQSQVNGFNGSCKNIKGDITIIGADITDLTPLKNIEAIDGKLTIQNNTILPSLKGLEKLASTKHLLIYNNDLLTDLTGLDGLKSITGTTHIRFNKKITSLKGLDNVTSASTLYISNNDLLVNLTGLGKLESVSDVFSISVNKSLTSLTGLSSLTSVSRILIGENELLPDLTGLESLTSVTYQMHVSSNKKLTSFKGLNNLTYLSELYISDNNLMTDLSGLESINGIYWLVVGESKGLTSLNGLNNLTSATNFIIRDNNLLTDLSGLENLSSIGWLQVTRNTELVSLSGLGPVSDGERSISNGRTSALTIGGLVLTDNSKLTTCAIGPVCNFISDNTASISGNGTGCDSRSALEIACASLPVTLTQFTAVAENRTAHLRWITAEESNSSVFEIEHSLDAKNWQKAGEYAAKGESNKPVNYAWIHQRPNIGLNYYRLKMIDLDGSYARSHIVSLKFDDLNKATTGLIYPNPVSDLLRVDNKNDILVLRIVNMQGKTVLETKSVPNEGISVKKLTTGLYQVLITRQNGEVQTERVAIF